MNNIVTYEPRIKITDVYAFYSLDRVDANPETIHQANTKLIEAYKEVQHISQIIKEATEQMLKSFTIQLYYERINYSTPRIIDPEGEPYTQFKFFKLHTAFKRLLLHKGDQQLKYAVLYCNSENKEVCKVARDIMFNQDRLQINNTKRLKLILEGNGAEVLELMK